MMIAAGRLNKKLQLQVQSAAKDGFGHKNKTDWEDVCTLFASVEPMSGRQMMASQQKIGEITHRVQMRYRDGINSGHRFLFRGRVLDIIQVINVKEAGAVLEILCKESIANG